MLESIDMKEGALKSKTLGSIKVNSFAVSKSRATAFVQDSERNVTVFDLEDDE